jgi:hypothetical protein
MIRTASANSRLIKAYFTVKPALVNIPPTVRYSTVWYSTVRYSTVWYSTVRYDMNRENASCKPLRSARFFFYTPRLFTKRSAVRTVFPRVIIRPYFKFYDVTNRSRPDQDTIQSDTYLWNWLYKRTQKKKNNHNSNIESGL